MKRRSYLLANAVMGLTTLTYLASCGVLVGNPDEKTGNGSTPPKSRVTQPEEAFEPQHSSGLSIHLMDAPVDDATAVKVKIARVEARHEEQGWLEFSSAHDSEIDLLTLQDGTTLALVDGEKAPEGIYQELRLVLDDAFEPSMTLYDGSQVSLKMPSGESSGLKIKAEFAVVADAPTEMVLDFDLRQSIHQTGRSYQLKPVLRAVEKSDSGMIVGSASKGAVACLYLADVEPESDSNCPGALLSSVAKNNGFTFAFVPVGTYNVRVFQNGAVSDYSSIVVVSRETTRLD